MTYETTCAFDMPRPPFSDFIWCSCCWRHLYMCEYGWDVSGFIYFILSLSRGTARFACKRTWMNVSNCSHHST